MTERGHIIHAYDTVADDYAAKWWNEFEGKHFDRIILNWFASAVPSDEQVLELGCGPGEVSGYLSRLSVNCVGTDASPKMIECAKRIFPAIKFEVHDFFNLTYEDHSFYAVIAYYAIVNYPAPAIATILSQVYRVLKPGGLFLFTFHLFEDEPVCLVQRFFDREINEIPFYFFRVDEVREIVQNIGFTIIDVLVRYPYPDVEFGSKRAYFLTRKT